MKSKQYMFIGALLVLAMGLFGIFAPLIGSSVNSYNLEERYRGPSLDHPFGQDENGSDVLMKVAIGARVSLSVALGVVFFSSVVGLLIGSVSGFMGGLVDMIVMRLIDVIYAFPGFLLALALVAALGPSLQNLFLALCLTGWTGYARLARGEAMHLRERDYVVAAKALGAGRARILAVHLWPNLLPPLLVQASFGVATTVLTESGLSFLGLGVPPDVPTWGSLLSSGRKIILEAPHVSLFPGMAIVILVFGFNLFGDGLRDYLDPKREQ